MPFTEQAQQYVTYYQQWDELGRVEYDASLSDLVASARNEALDGMAFFDQKPEFRQEMLDVALASGEEKRRSLLEELDSLAQTASGLLSDEQIEAKRAEIRQAYPEHSEEDTTFARAFVLANVLGEMILPSLGGLNTEKEPDKTSPEYAGASPLLSYREAFFIVGTLIARGDDKVDELRLHGIDIPEVAELERLHATLRSSMSLSDRQEVEAMFAQPNERNEKLVRVERQRAADRVLALIGTNELEAQYEFLMNNYEELDPRCYIMDFIDNIPQESLPFVHDVLERISDPAVPIVNMAGRTTGVAFGKPAPRAADSETPAGSPDEAGLDQSTRPADAYSVAIEPGDVAVEITTEPEVPEPERHHDEPEAWLRATVEEAFASTVDMFREYGIDLDVTIPTTDLNRFPMITFALRTQAKGISGLLSEAARKSSRKATHNLSDIVVLTAYSMRRELFDDLASMTEQERRQAHSTRPRQIRKLIDELTRTYAEEHPPGSLENGES